MGYLGFICQYRKHPSRGFCGLTRLAIGVCILPCVSNYIYANGFLKTRVCPKLKTLVVDVSTHLAMFTRTSRVVSLKQQQKQPLMFMHGCNEVATIDCSHELATQQKHVHSSLYYYFTHSSYLQIAHVKFPGVDNHDS